MTTAQPTGAGVPLRLAGAQLSATDEPAHNLDLVRDAAARAADAGARVLVTPEATLASFATGRLDAVAQPLDGPFADGVRAVGERYGLVLVVGTFTPADEVATKTKNETGSRRRVHNTLLVTGPGAAETAYRKIHLYDAFGARESDTVAPGEERCVVEVDGWRVGLATCFDVRFPEHFTALAADGAEVIVLPASWGDGPGKAEQWDLLTRARAADAQSWLLAVGQSWTPQSQDGPYGIGRSALLSPTGEVRQRLGAGSGLLVAEIDHESVTRTRETVPLPR